jgi:hypothetical protein
MQTCFGQSVSTVTWGHASSPGAQLAAVDNCGQGERMQITGPTVGASDSVGAYAQWSTLLPPSMSLTGMAVPEHAAVINPYSQNASGGSGYNVRFLWGGGSYRLQDAGSCCGKLDYAKPVLMGISGRYFIVQVACTDTSAHSCLLPVNSTREIVGVKDLTLVAQDNAGPGITAVPQNNLWYQGGRWVRGSWQISTEASDDSGVCDMWDQVDGTTIQGPATTTRDQSSWTQCPNPQAMTQTLDTTAYPDGPLTLTLGASDAAQPANSSSPTETLDVDNAPVTVSLSGPADWPSTAGPGQVTASATAGPSGVAGIWCSVDGSPLVPHSGASATIAVTGLGSHAVQCQARNNAYDASGQTAASPMETWEGTIREPTVFGGPQFTKEVNGLRCRRVKERVEVPARWVTIKGRRVRRRAHLRTRHIRRCHERIVRRRVTVWTTVHRHGKTIRVRHVRLVRVVLLPHRVTRSRLRVAHGHPATVSGWLGTAAGTALGGQRVQVLAAPDDGQGRFAPVAVATTRANGTWAAMLRPGPSRLIEASFAGSDTLEPAASAQARLTVPAKVRLVSVKPRRVAWGGRVRIVGRLVGGHLPPDGALVRLRLGSGSSYTTYGVKEHVTGSGRFTTSFRFGAGVPSVHRTFWFELASLPMGDYPFSPADSNRRFVIVGGHPPSRCRRSTKLCM